MASATRTIEYKPNTSVYYHSLISVRPEICYTKQFVYYSVAISLINTKRSHHTILGVRISCVKFQGWIYATFWDVGG